MRRALAPGARRHLQRQSVPGAGAFWLMAGAFVLLPFATGAPTPMYRVYQAQWRFSAATMTAVFVVYALALLRRPVVLRVFVRASGTAACDRRGARSGRGRVHPVLGASGVGFAEDEFAGGGGDAGLAAAVDGVERIGHGREADRDA